MLDLNKDFKATIIIHKCELERCESTQYLREEFFWAVISAMVIIGPVFIDGTVNHSNHLHVLQTEL